jgi:cytochrome c-type biogenesis protein CcmH
MLADKELEMRAREISKGLRCPVCQNQSIDDSDADLSSDLRVLVRERLLEGDSDKEVVDYVVSRYGEYVLLEPPLQKGTIFLWAGPLLFLVIGGVAVFAFFRGSKNKAKNI